MLTPLDSGIKKSTLVLGILLAFLLGGVAGVVGARSAHVTTSLVTASPYQSTPGFDRALTTRGLSTSQQGAAKTDAARLQAFVASERTGLEAKGVDIKDVWDCLIRGNDAACDRMMDAYAKL